jgi:hypothetical protein
LIAFSSALLPALAAGSFVLSVSYDIGYFVRLGINPGVVPTTLADHTRSALLWLPFVAVVLLVSGLADLLEERTPIPEWAASHPTQYSALVVLTAPLHAVIFIWIVLSDGFGLALFLNPGKLSFFLVYLIWFQVFVAPVLVRHYLRSRRNNPEHWTTSEKLFAISGWVVLVLILGYLVALAETQIEVLRKHPRLVASTVRAYVKSDKPGAVLKVLRSFEKGVLVQEVDTAQIRFFQWNDVVSIGYPTD